MTSGLYKAKSARPAEEKPRILPKLILSLILGGLFAWLAERGGVPIFPAREQFAQMDWAGVGFATLLLALLTVLRATRWRSLAHSGCTYTAW